MKRALGLIALVLVALLIWKWLTREPVYDTVHVGSAGDSVSAVRHARDSAVANSLARLEARIAGLQRANRTLAVHADSLGRALEHKLPDSLRLEYFVVVALKDSVIDAQAQEIGALNLVIKIRTSQIASKDSALAFYQGQLQQTIMALGVANRRAHPSFVARLFRNADLIAGAYVVGKLLK